MKPRLQGDWGAIEMVIAGQAMVVHFRVNTVDTPNGRSRPLALHLSRIRGKL